MLEAETGRQLPSGSGWLEISHRADGSRTGTLDEPIDLSGLVTNQSGIIGDITADQMLQHLECSAAEFVRLCYEGKRPHTMLRKALYLEWYSNSNGRVVIQSTRLAVERLGERAFELTEEEWAEQASRNREEITYFLHQLCDAADRLLPPDTDA